MGAGSKGRNGQEYSGLLRGGVEKKTQREGWEKKCCHFSFALIFFFAFLLFALLVSVREEGARNERGGWAAAVRGGKKKKKKGKCDMSGVSKLGGQNMQRLQCRADQRVEAWCVLACV